MILTLVTMGVYNKTLTITNSYGSGSVTVKFYKDSCKNYLAYNYKTGIEAS